MAKLESSLKNMVLSLGIISIVAAGLLAGAYMLTKDTIAATALAKQEAAKAAVLNGQEGTPVEVEVDGFGGKVKIMFGFAADGTILGYEVLEQQETPGLGTHMVEWFKNAEKPGQNVIGRKATGEMKVSKDGGDVDAITAATISSRAFVDALNKAYAEFAGTEAVSGATVQEHEGCCGHHEEGCCGHHEGGCGHCGDAEHACAGECQQGEHACEHHCHEAEGCCEHNCEHHEVVND